MKDIIPDTASVDAPKNEIVVYQPNKTTRLEVRLGNETVWLNRQQIAMLFGRDVKTIGKHISNALSEELAFTGDGNRTVANSATVEAVHPNPVVAKFATTAADGKIYQVEYFSLEVVSSVGYRVKSREGIMFRRWANQVLKEVLLRGVAINDLTKNLAAEMDRRFASHEQRIAAVERRVDFVIESALPPPEMVFCEGEFLSAHEAIRKIVCAARRRLILIDNYIDERVFTLLAERRADVPCAIYGRNADKRDVQLAFERYREQVPKDNLTLVTWNKTHDRFIVCDNTVWICGASVKDAGRRMFALVKTSLDPNIILAEVPLSV